MKVQLGTKRRGNARALRAGLALAMLTPQLTGCYTHVPVSTAAVPHGAEVSVLVTEPGRAALAEQVGPGVRRLGGGVLERTDTTLVLAVRSVEYLDLGVTARWAGERVEVGRDFVGELRERRLSRPRTGAMAAIVAAFAVAATFVSLTGSGGDPGPSRPPDSGNQQ
jgi:hypothetical protein